jgi:putative endonuclease
MTQAEPTLTAWAVYVLRCSDGSFYCGITTDVERRVREHNGLPTGAAYTRARRPVTLVTSWASPDRSSATKTERAFKRLSRKAKELRVATKGQEGVPGAQPSTGLPPRAP